MLKEGAPNNPKTTPAETEPRDGGARGRAGNLPNEVLPYTTRVFSFFKEGDLLALIIKG